MARHALGIDIGGTYTKLGIVDESGQISHFRKSETNAKGEDPSNFLQALESQMELILSEYGGDILGIGLSVHGHLDVQRRRQILGNSTPALRGVDLFGFVRHRFGYKPILNNDLTAHALSEYHFGAGKGSNRFLCLAIGTGLGAGVVAGGKPIRYIEGTSGDTGRIILDPNGPLDMYGVRGSAEILCGISSIERLAREQYGRPVKAHDVIAAARDKEDAIAANIMQQIGDYLGQTLAILSPIFLPDTIALTGGTTEAGDVLLEACKKRFAILVGTYHETLQRLAPDFYPPVSIKFGEMLGETGVVGAVVELFSAPCKNVS